MTKQIRDHHLVPQRVRHLGFLSEKHATSSYNRVPLTMLMKLHLIATVQYSILALARTRRTAYE